MSKLKKRLYIIDLLSRRGSMSLKEINEHYQYSSLYDGEIIPRTFARYKDYKAETFPCYIEYNSATNEFSLKRYHLAKTEHTHPLSEVQSTHLSAENRPKVAQIFINAK